MSFVTPPPPPPPPPSGGFPTAPPPGYQTGPQLAGLGARFVSLLLDGVIQFLMALPFAAVSVVGFAKGVENCPTTTTDAGIEITCEGDQLQVGWILLGVAAAFVGLIVVLFLYAKWLGKGATPAMKMFGMRLVDANSGLPVGTGRAFGRMLFATFLSGNLCFIGYLWALWDKRRQTLHDKVIGAIVVKAG